MPVCDKFDAVVVGAGVFGAWTAHSLYGSGMRVALIDAYGAANSRASSGGESRILRCGYGSDAVYTSFAQRSLQHWIALSERAGIPIFQPTGVLWLADASDHRLAETIAVFDGMSVPYDMLTASQVAERFPQFSVRNGECGIFETQAGALLARRGVQTLTRELSANGVELVWEPVQPPKGTGNLHHIETMQGRKLYADRFVFACGPWLGKLFPDVLGDRIFPTRQEVFFFGVPAGDHRFRPSAMPCWILSGSLYGIPDLEHRGFKIADDAHGRPLDPDTEERLVGPSSVAGIRAELESRFPALRGAPLLETRVCQYESTSNGDFLLDRHPQFGNVWFAGGGSGHGFKHGPAVGEYMKNLILGAGPAEPRFSLASKQTSQFRSVF
jgi:sarcosine oxidase